MNFSRVFISLGRRKADIPSVTFIIFAQDVVLPTLNSPSYRDVRHEELVKHVYEEYCVRSLTILVFVSKGSWS